MNPLTGEKITDTLFRGIRLIKPGDFMIERFQFLYEATIATAFTFILRLVVYYIHHLYD